MNTETDTDNKYIQELRSKNLDHTAENLLHIMRPIVEEILLDAACVQPPSQTERAKRVLEHLVKQRRKIVNSKPTNMKMFSHVSKKIRTLEAFMAVHQTVWILEGKPVH